MKPTLRWSEYQQLELIPPSVRRYPTWREHFQQLLQQAITRLHPSPIEIWLTPNEAGICWNAIDRVTGDRFFKSAKMNCELGSNSVICTRSLVNGSAMFRSLFAP
ncbi:MAG: hypothetical protein HC895_12820 [Leptolyngbyaceae cyanobacterium SM1_3_5]|nr:hypothetical protein [Leptolyngbyaceae cyanobacterium SM1_3_5]